jgi:hypothetical protein
MIQEVLPATLTTLGILYLGATTTICALFTLDRKHERNLQKHFVRNGTAGVCFTIIGSILNIIQNI